MHTKVAQLWSRPALWLNAVLACAAILGVAPVHAQSSAVIENYQVPRGGTLTVQVSGFAGDEQLVSWVSSTRGTVYVTEPARAGSNGSATLQIRVRRFWEAGWWAVTVHGRNKGRRVTASFQVLPSPSSGRLDVAPASPRRGARVTFQGTGFVSDEPVAAWITMPDERVVPIECNSGGSRGSGDCSRLMRPGGSSTIPERDDPLCAGIPGTENPDSAAVCTCNIQFSFDVAADALPGTWHVTAYGTRSERLLVSDFTVTP